jgi:superoxide reductase
MSGEKFYVCKSCGNLVGVIHASGAPLVCCGKPMEALVANSTEAAQEKHVPEVAVNGATVTVKVGSVAHPMTAEHHIAWVYLQTEQGGQRKNLAVGAKPEVEFALAGGDKAVAAFAYCNLHGLWVKEL